MGRSLWDEYIYCRLHREMKDLQLGSCMEEKAEIMNCIW